jgi:hypothetical protein
MARKAISSDQVSRTALSASRAPRSAKRRPQVAQYESSGIISPDTRQRNDLDGGLVEVTVDGVLGWVWNPADPAAPVEAYLVCNGEVLGPVVADLFDNERIRACKGAGVPGFLAKLLARPTGSYPITLELRSRRGDLLGDTLVVNHPRELGPGPNISSDGTPNFEGYVDFVADGYVTGWAWSPLNPDEQLNVELMEDGQRLDRKPAFLYRADLASNAKRNGYCGFRLELPVSLLDERVHSLKVVIANTEFELPGCSLNFGSLNISPLLKEVGGLRAEVARLTAQVERVVSPHGELQIKLIQTISERMGALLEVQRETVQAEIEALRALALRPASNELEIRGVADRTGNKGL